MSILIDLRQLREAAGVSQQAVAEHLQITRQAFSHIESGNRRLPAKYAEQIADFLGYKIVLVPKGLDELPMDNEQLQVSPKERFSLIRLLYREVPAGMLSTRALLNRCLVELSNTDLDDLNRLTVAFLDGRNMRRLMVKTCQAMVGIQNQHVK
jgi:transcriptional regulator with XRE-family HTH domain